MSFHLGLRGNEKPIFRVVETQRGSDGRLTQIGQIWHTDLDEVRRFGRAVAANTVSRQVLIADAAGNVLEEIKVPQNDPIGFDNWRDVKLPPLPPIVLRKKPRLAVRAPAPAPALAAAPAVAATPPATTSPPAVDLPVVHNTVVPSDQRSADVSLSDSEMGTLTNTDVAVVLP